MPKAGAYPVPAFFLLFFPRPTTPRDTHRTPMNRRGANGAAPPESKPGNEFPAIPAEAKVTGHRGRAHLVSLDRRPGRPSGRREVPAPGVVDRDDVDLVALGIQGAEDRVRRFDRHLVLDRTPAEQQADPKLPHHPPPPAPR